MAQVNYYLDLDILHMKCDTGRTVRQELNDAARKMVYCMKAELNSFYASYKPKVYKRTRGLSRCFRVMDICNIRADLNGASIDIAFNENSIHPSLWGGSVNVLSLMNYGYRVKSGWHKDIPYFGFRHGSRFIEKAIANFKKQDHLGLAVNLELGR